MKIIDFNVDHVPNNDKRLVLCLGFYDGLHLGHQKLIKEALKTRLPVGVMTFDVAPAILLGKKENFCLTSTADKAELLEKMGIKYLYLMHFEKQTLKMTKDEFIDVVLKPLNPQKIFVGPDYKFGLYAEGDIRYLKQFFDVVVVPFKKKDKQKIASKSIRQFVENGEMEKARSFLGRPYSVCGLVVQGLKNGQRIGFPTANIDLDYSYVFPKEGVYMGYAYFGNKKRKALISIGTHPTINQLLKPIIEVYLIDFQGDLYGKQLRVEFISYMRDNFLFPHLDALKQQLIKDEIIAKNTLK